jgi:uncharacterized protein (DUF1499 family)
MQEFVGGILRGLTENHSGWDCDVQSRSPTEVAEHLVTMIEKAARWDVIRRAVSGDSMVIYATRKTRIFRFTDDVRIELSARPSGATHIHASSRSRIGKGDLGQNDRNLNQVAGWLTKPF